MEGQEPDYIDEAFVDLLIEELGASLRHFALSLVNAEDPLDVEDILQEVWGKFWRTYRDKAITERDNWSALLHTMVRNEVIKTRRNTRRRKKLEYEKMDDLPKPSGGGDMTSDEVVSQDQLKYIYGKLNSLSVEDQEIIESHINCKLKEYAERRGVSTATIYRKWNLAIERFRKLLTDND